jgi:hypothetical protein
LLDISKLHWHICVAGAAARNREVRHAVRNVNTVDVRNGCCVRVRALQLQEYQCCIIQAPKAVWLQLWSCCCCH